MSNKIAYFHRNCWDGTFAALVFNFRYPDADLIDFSYGDPLPAMETFEGKEVYLLDLTIPDDDLRRMADVAERVHVLDHHPAALRQRVELKELTDKNVVMFVGNDVAGSMLAARYFLPSDVAPTVEILRWAEQYDRFVFEDPMTRQFMYGVSTLKNDWKAFKEFFGEHALKYMFTTPNNHPDYMRPIFVDELLLRGEIIAPYRENQLQYFIDNCQTRMTIDGYHVVAVNAPRLFASELAEKLYKMYTFAESPFIAVFYEERGHLTYSLRCDKYSPINLDVIARKFGGGGHRSAAGFKVRIAKAPLEPRESSDIKTGTGWWEWLRQQLKVWK